MTWDNLEAKAPDPDAVERQKADATALAGQVRAAFTDAPLMHRLVTDMANMRSYRPGADLAAVAYTEGFRAAAIQLLQLAGEKR